jgi:hypothetical protein
MGENTLPFRGIIISIDQAGWESEIAKLVEGTCSEDGGWVRAAIEGIEQKDCGWAEGSDGKRFSERLFVHFALCGCCCV